MKKWMSVYAIIALSFLIFINPASAGTPSISGLSDFVCVEQDPATVIDGDVGFSGGSSYADGYLKFSLASPNAGDQMVLTSDPDPNASGSISVSGDDIYLGNGVGRDRIGAIDATENGTNGQTLKILFSSPLENASFETNSTDGWDVHAEDYGTGFDGQSIPYVYDSGSGTATINAGTDSSMSFSVGVQSSNVSTGTYALQLYSYGYITCSIPDGASSPDGYCSIHGPSITSSAFTAENGDQLYVDWAAQDGGDWYEVFGYLVEAGTDNTFGTGDDTRTKLFSQRGDTQDWTTTSQTISAAGTYKFEFISGSYDYSGGLLTGASLYVDNIRIINATAVSDTVVSSIARLVTFENTSDDPPGTARTLTVTAGAEDGSTGSATSTITITPVNDNPTDIFLSNTEIDAAGGINCVVGLFSSTDPDSSSFTYSLVAGDGDADNSLFNISGSNLRVNDADMAGGSYQIRIESSDGAGGTFEKRFTLTVADTDGDGISDVREGTDDTDGDGTPDYQDTDSDGDGIDDADEGTIDTDGDGTPDYLDVDSDGDGINDDEEGSSDIDGDGISDYLDTDSDGDGIADVDEGTDDTDGDGTPDYADSDSDGDGIGDSVEGNTDTDGDGTPDFQDTESDGDGVDDDVENGAANNGDGNNDGTPDRLQSRVTTLMSYDETVYVTIESQEGTSLTDVMAIDNPSPDDMPEGSHLPHGLYDFTINNVDVGGSVTLTLYLPEGSQPDSYLKYGPTPDDETDHWYEFVYDGVTGAEIDGNVITLHFVDGDEGDDALTADGMIIDAGGPMVDSGDAPDSGDYGPMGGGGCFVGSLTTAGHFSGLVAGALAALLGLTVSLRLRALRKRFGVAGLIIALIMIAPGTGRAGDDASDAFTSFYLNAGIGVAYIDENIGADYQGHHYEMKVDNDIYPVLRAGYAFSDNLALELGFRWDIYSGEMDRSGAGGSGNPKGYTFLLGPVYTFDEYQCKFLGPLKPLVHLDLGYTLLHDDPDYPISRFDPAFGVDIAVGVVRKSIDLRLGYRYFELDGGDLQSGTTSAEDSLNLSGLYMEIAWRFDFGK